MEERFKGHLEEFLDFDDVAKIVIWLCVVVAILVNVHSFYSSCCILEFSYISLGQVCR
jgi:hypothetical protein